MKRNIRKSLATIFGALAFLGLAVTAMADDREAGTQMLGDTGYIASCPAGGAGLNADQLAAVGRLQTEHERNVAGLSDKLDIKERELLVLTDRNVLDIHAVADKTAEVEALKDRIAHEDMAFNRGVAEATGKDVGPLFLASAEGTVSCPVN